MKIINLKPSEINNIVPLWLEFIQDENGSDKSIVPDRENCEKWEGFVRGLLENGKGSIKVAVEKGKYVGYILYGWKMPLKLIKPRAVIYDLYVKPEYRGRGIGTMLLRETLEDLRKRGFEEVRLTVLSKNQGAISLYERFGFREELKIMELRMKVHKD